LWYDKEARTAAELYTSVIPGSKITHIQTLHDTPSGDADIVSFELAGQPFMAISAGPIFKFNPSISFHVKCASKEEVDLIWSKLSEGGKVLMPVASYPFSERYGWCEDRWGLSWQIIYTGGAPITQKITPALTYVGAVAGKAEEAINFYVDTFKNAPGGSGSVVMKVPYGKGEEPEKEGAIKYSHFMLLEQEFGAMDSFQDHKFAFNEAISFMVPCENQQEIDYFWEKMSAVPASEQCGWIKDKYGVSWQISSTAMEEMLTKGTQEQVARVTQAFLKMKKFDIAALQKVFDGK